MLKKSSAGPPRRTAPSFGGWGSRSFGIVGLHCRGGRRLIELADEVCQLVLSQHPLLAVGELFRHGDGGQASGLIDLRQSRSCGTA